VKLGQIRWDSVAKIGAGVLVAVALATSLPSLLGSEKPKPLDSDVGLPQAALPPSAPPVPPPPAPKKPKRKPKPPKRPPKHRRRQKKPAGSAIPPIISAAAPIAPAGSAENFGFERP
jgi:hypothetical protein